ncbi:hypothetical protein D6C89_07417 [Aureobasidium pullulans]|nr:hypothetical protein D6C89_07417 [Aureobasidium pullulans]
MFGQFLGNLNKSFFDQYGLIFNFQDLAQGYTLSGGRLVAVTRPTSRVKFRVLSMSGPPLYPTTHAALSYLIDEVQDMALLLSDRVSRRTRRLLSNCILSKLMIINSLVLHAVYLYV